MNQRTGEIAADAAWPAADQGPNPPVALMLVYNGSARPPRPVVDAWNRPTLMGFESSTTRAYAGGDAGEQDSGWSCDRYDEWGYGRDLGSWVCAADTPSTPGQFLPNITEYGRRYALRQIAGGRFGPITWYGNPAAVEAACAGCRAAGVIALRWGVGTWGYGEGGGPNQPPAQADAELIQSGNTPGPLAVPSDLNWLYVVVSTFAAYAGGAAPAPTPKTTEGYEMLAVVVGDGFFAKDKQVYLIVPGVSTERVDDDSANFFEVLARFSGIPATKQPASWVDGQIAIGITQFKRNQALDAFLANPTGGGGAPGPGPGPGPYAITLTGSEPITLTGTAVPA